MSKQQDVEFTSPLTPDKSPSLHHHHPRNRNVFILKSLSIILLLTVLVLGINYYLISNCPSETSSSQEPNAISSRISQSPDNNELLATTPHYRVTVSVYYEVLCPDSKSFILHQLVPVQRKYGRLVNVRYVPFGKASYSGSDDNLQFHCQHGNEECHGNKLHACIVESHPTDQTLQTDIIGCSMDRYRLWGSTERSITEITKECRQKFAPDDTSPLPCSNSSLLLKMHGHETLTLKPSVTFIPTIAIDGSLGNQRQILRDLDGVVCKALRTRNPSQSC